MKKLSALAILLILLAQFNIASAQINGHSNNEGFTITPADPINPDIHNFTFALKPGSQVENFVEIRNMASYEETFLLYGADPTFSAQGTPAYKTRQDGGTGEGQWIAFDEPQTTLAPGEKRTMRFTVNVPAKTVLGKYRAGIAMEKTKKDANNPGITIATRLILHSNINVTDNPAALTGAIIEEKSTDTGFDWRMAYFWVSLILFMASFIALIWITLLEKKEKSKKAAPSKTATKTRPARKPARKHARKTTKRATTRRKSSRKKPRKK